MEIKLDPYHVQLALKITKATDDAKEGKTTFIKVYPNGANVHIKEYRDLAAEEIEKLIAKRKAEYEAGDAPYGL